MAIFYVCGMFVIIGSATLLLGYAANHNWDGGPWWWTHAIIAGTGAAAGETWRRRRRRKRQIEQEQYREATLQWQRARQDALAYNSGAPYEQVVTGPGRVPGMPPNGRQQPAAEDPDGGRPREPRWQPPR